MNERFEFGKNWAHFLTVLTEERILASQRALSTMLGRDDLSGLTFLDIGSGSGLSSLAARRLGAKVHSFDFDRNSVVCTQSLKERFFKDDPSWSIEQGSALDEEYLSTLGEFDIVYSWGVLHHTGEMWRGIQNATSLVKPQGSLFIAIYNDQGAMSKVWHTIKRFYNRSGALLRFLLVCLIGILTESAGAIVRLLSGRNPLPFTRWRQVKAERGMSVWHDLVDWVGGYPFEVASPEAIFEFVKPRGFVLEKLVTKRGGWGCCEYVFMRSGE